MPHKYPQRTRQRNRHLLSTSRISLTTTPTFRLTSSLIPEDTIRRLELELTEPSGKTGDSRYHASFYETALRQHSAEEELEEDAEGF